MSKLFFDHLIEFEEVEIELNGLDISSEEKKELEQLVDSMVHHRVIDRILTHLPRHHHAEFIDRFHKAPYDPKLLSWINQKIEATVEKHVKDEIKKLKQEILEDIHSSHKNKSNT